MLPGHSAAAKPATRTHVTYNALEEYHGIRVASCKSNKVHGLKEAKVSMQVAASVQTREVAFFERVSGALYGRCAKVARAQQSVENKACSSGPWFWAASCKGLRSSWHSAYTAQHYASSGEDFGDPGNIIACMQTPKHVLMLSDSASGAEHDTLASLIFEVHETLRKGLCWCSSAI